MGESPRRKLPQPRVPRTKAGMESGLDLFPPAFIPIVLPNADIAHFCPNEREEVKEGGISKPQEGIGKSQFTDATEDVISQPGRLTVTSVGTFFPFPNYN